ncbi:MAG: hypothetical protein U0587_08990 [Candidatus Binatia bacterium]
MAVFVGEHEVALAGLNRAPLQPPEGGEDSRVVAAVDLALAGLRRRLYAAPTGDATALDLDRLPVEVEPVEADRQNLRRSPAEPEPHVVEVTVPGRHGLNEELHLVDGQRIGVRPHQRLAAPARQLGDRVGIDQAVLDGVGHRLVQNAEDVPGGLAGQLVVLELLAEVLAARRRELIQAQLAEGRLQVAADDRLVVHPRRGMQVGAVGHLAVLQERRAPLVPVVEVVADQRYLASLHDHVVRVEVGETSAVGEMLAVVEGAEGDLALDH